MAWMPGALKKEVPKFRTRMSNPRAVCLHVAVSEAASLYGFFSGAKVCSHFYVRKDGTIEQYVSTAYQAPANGAGNSSLISVETQGGVRNANSEPWTPAQREALAKISAWASKTHRIPLIAMPNSKRTSVGIGYHRLGVDPYRVSGGEKWSSAYGKICPGAGKIAQIPSIVTRARQLQGDGPSLPDTGGELSVSDINTLLKRLDYLEEQNKANGQKLDYVQSQCRDLAERVNSTPPNVALHPVGRSGLNVGQMLDETRKSVEVIRTAVSK